MKKQVTVLFLIIALCMVGCGKEPVEPTATPTQTNSPSLSPTSSPTATTGPTATNTPMPTATNTPKPTATNTPKPTATNTPVPTATNTPTPTEAPITNLGYYFAGVMNTSDFYYQDGYVYQMFPVIGKFDETTFEEEVLYNCLIKYKVLDIVTASSAEIEEGRLLDCYLLEEVQTGMICYLDVPSGQGRFGAAETNYLYCIMLTQYEYDYLKSKGLIKKDVDPQKLDKTGGVLYGYTRPVSARYFTKSEFFVAEKYKK